MTELQQLFTSALDDEPTSKLSAADLAGEVARRGRRRAVVRRTGSLVGGAAIVSIAAGVIVGVAQTGDDTGRGAAAPHESAAQPTAVRKTADDSGDVITAESLPGIVQSRGDLRLSAVLSQNLDRSSYVNLSAAITSVAGRPAKSQYLNVQVSPKELPSVKRTCAEMSDLSRDGDGYYGPCKITRTADGSFFVERSGTTKRSGYTIAEATLIRADGSGVTAEASNQLHDGKHKTQPVVSAEPPISSAELADLVRQLGQLPLRR